MRHEAARHGAAQHSMAWHGAARKQGACNRQSVLEDAWRTPGTARSVCSSPAPRPAHSATHLKLALQAVRAVCALVLHVWCALPRLRNAPQRYRLVPRPGDHVAVADPGHPKHPVHVALQAGEQRGARHEEGRQAGGWVHRGRLVLAKLPR